MKCVICRHGETAPGTTTAHFEQDGMLFVMRGVPAEVCANCGEAYVSSEAAAVVLRAAGEARARHASVEIQEYHAA